MHKHRANFSARAALAALATLASAPITALAATALVDFENAPVLSTGPSIFVAVPGPQTITSGPATFTGGVVLGFATFFPAISFATAPNVYGTADFGNHLQPLLTISMDPAFFTTEVSFALFNGEVFSQSYIVNAFNGSSVVASQTLASIAPNFNAGYGIADVVALGGITSVTIAPTGNPAAFDFLIDTVAFNQSINSIPNPPPPPVDQPPAPPVHGHRHGHGEGEIELLEVNFGDDVNDIRGSVIVVTPVPEPGSWALMLLGCAAVATRVSRRCAPR
jgi:hypothetical protein